MTAAEGFEGERGKVTATPKSGDIIRRFESMGAFVEGAMARADQYGASHRRGDNWTGSESFADAIELGENGWMEVRDKVEGLTAGLIGQVREMIVPAIDWQLSTAGGPVAMGRYMVGDPRCQLRPVMVEGRGQRPVTRILVSGTCSAAVKAKTIIRRGVAVVALIELLAFANRAVELYVENTVSPTTGRSTRTHTTVTRVKEASEPLDVNRVMFAMAHPSMQRRLVFASQEGEPDSVRKTFGFGGGDYGLPLNLKMGDAIGADVKCETLRPGTTWDTASSVRWIVQTLRDCGVSVDEGEGN